MNYCVVTTVNKPTKAIEELHKRFFDRLIVIGDVKTAEDWQYRNTNFIPIGSQSGFLVSKHIPENHYSRKNIGYLEAMKNGAELIYDTDDDNIPWGEWKLREIDVTADYISANKWVNVYQSFWHWRGWPRGLPLKDALYNHTTILDYDHKHKSSIQQGLSDIHADVDAVYRILIDKPITFDRKRSVTIYPSIWCPFNSQSTWWFPNAYPLMYLPIHASFRMTDIWRSFIAQRCLWEIGEGVTFHSPAEVFQQRNEHDLLKDFEDEVPGYLKNDFIAGILGKLELKREEDFVCENLLTCYMALIKHNILPEAELPSVEAWVEDYGNATRNMG